MTSPGQVAHAFALDHSVAWIDTMAYVIRYDRLALLDEVLDRIESERAKSVGRAPGVIIRMVRAEVEASR